MLFSFSFKSFALSYSDCFQCPLLQTLNISRSGSGIDWLRAGQSGDRKPLGVRFSAPVQPGRGAHPNSCAMDTGSFLGVEAAEAWG